MISRLGSGAFTGRALTSNTARVSVGGVSYGGTTYALNANACAARFEQAIRLLWVESLPTLPMD